MQSGRFWLAILIRRRTYAKLFDWEVKTNNALNYRMVDTGSGGINGGIWPAPPKDTG